MATSPGRIFSREELLTEVWGSDGRPHAKVVDMHIHRLRHKLEMDPGRPKYIATVHGRGYRAIR